MEIGRDAHGIKSLSRHFLEQVVALSSEGILVVDAQDASLPVVYANPAYEHQTGYSVAELMGRPWSMLAREADNDPELQRLRVAIGRAESCRVTVPELRKDGTVRVAEIRVAPLTNARGENRYFACVHKHAEPAAAANAHDTPDGVEPAEPSGEVALLQRELGRARQKIASLDRIDPTTGLLRFGHFQDTLRRDLGVARRDRRFVTLLVFDIIELDVYRQTFGGKAADSCQRMIGAQITRTLRRAGDLCARYDECTLVAAVIGQTPEQMRPLTDQIVENVRQLGLHNPRGRSGRYLTVRPIAIGCPPGTQDDAQTLVARALAEPRTGGARVALAGAEASSRGSATG
ncbi:MAG TPA: PAS domain S-box protein [Gammaproteobacteria bacterium]|jgi:PAS domain S-box-containing protein/diguanylate cyclase (GGDEF)-like protein|nr:PAS domain S-box protein [Gammaproteobacteria bacterium]